MTGRPHNAACLSLACRWGGGGHHSWTGAICAASGGGLGSFMKTGPAPAMMQHTQGSSEEQPGHNMLSVMQAQAKNSLEGVDGACEWGGGTRLSTERENE